MKYAIVDLLWAKSHGIEILPEMRTSIDQSKVILHVEHYDLLFKSLDMQADDEPQYPYPVYDSPSSELESVLSSKEWVSDVNDERL